ncbi:BMA-CLIC-1 [Dirofilaria immitis]|nr:BMA-CLIC-1 [Dirofilaria immitis]
MKIPKKIYKEKAFEEKKGELVTLIVEIEGIFNAINLRRLYLTYVGYRDIHPIDFISSSASLDMPIKRFSGGGNNTTDSTTIDLMDIAERKFISVLLFIFTYSFFVRSEICYRCANEFIVMHWGHFLPIQADDQLISDSICTEIDERSEVIRCAGPCLTLNVTIGEDNRSRLLGMMRDCQKKYFNRDSDNNRTCQNQTIKIRQNLLNAEYCFCLGRPGGAVCDKTFELSVYCSEKTPEKGSRSSSSDRITDFE